VVVLFVCLTAIGCGGANTDLPSTAPVTGRVTYQDQPVSNGLVTFHPANGSKPASGQTGKNGDFTLSTFERGDGAIFGKHKVTIVAYQEGQDVSIVSADKLAYAVPKKYVNEATTSLEAEVKEGTNDIVLELKD
tara:strand:- start:4087 stop:4488 length:402 start_codon:yes stop_codon:yes gene_type:complete